MIETNKFIDALKRFHYSQFSGVPCSYLKPFINYVIDEPSLDYIGAASEGEAVAISLGAFLAGRKTVTMCQNSGLGNMVNPLTSLNFPFRIPTLLVVTWRGKPGERDEPQHQQMGEITPHLLDLLDIPWSIFPQTDKEIDPILDKADAYMRKESRPYALIMPKNSVAPHHLKSKPAGQKITTKLTLYPGDPAKRLSRTRAIELITKFHGSERAIVATTGKTGRELFTINDSPNHIYVVGGMGTASSIGLGISHVLPSQPVTILDGDGALLMKMGSLATIGHYQPKSYLHVVLDNEQHDSTGGQRTVSSTVQFAQVAAASNYSAAAFAENETDISDALEKLSLQGGPSLLHVKIKPGSPEKLGRPTIQPFQVRDRFMKYLNPLTKAIG